jgi:WD repeat-containing protein 70
MNSGLKPFKTIEPIEGQPIHHLDYSISGDSLLVIASSLQPKLYSREGVEITEFAKGDVYIRDMRHTKGHVGEVTCSSWNPKNRNEFISSSADSTVRVWDVNNKWEHKALMVVRGKGTGPGQRTKITTCAYSPGGRWIGAAATDGTVHLWGANGPYTKSMSVDGHRPQTETSGITFSQDENYLVTRGGDETVKRIHVLLCANFSMGCS